MIFYTLNISTIAIQKISDFKNWSLVLIIWSVLSLGDFVIKFQLSYKHKRFIDSSISDSISPGYSITVIN
jgi:hypothetical protein